MYHVLAKTNMACMEDSKYCLCFENKIIIKSSLIRFGKCLITRIKFMTVCVVLLFFFKNKEVSSLNNSDLPWVDSFSD